MLKHWLIGSIVLNFGLAAFKEKKWLQINSAWWLLALTVESRASNLVSQTDLNQQLNSLRIALDCLRIELGQTPLDEWKLSSH